jgi:VanZ family protein
MAVRDTLFRVTPKRTAPDAPPANDDPPKTRGLKARTARNRAAKSADPTTREPKARAPRTRTPRAPEPKAGAPRSRTPRPRTAPEPRRPVLQRRSLGSTLARAAVLAIAIVGMVGFAVALAKVTLVPSPASVNLIHTNLKPGASIRAYLDQPETRDTVKQIGGNILLGVPFGILLPTLFPRARGLIRVVLITAFVMVLVEAAQGAIVEGRAFDIDDVILNTFGALLGYLLLGRRLGRALHPRRTHWWHRLGFGTPPETRTPATVRARDTAADDAGDEEPAERGGWFRRSRRPARTRQ